MDTCLPLGEFRFSKQEDKFNFGIMTSSAKLSKDLFFTTKTGNLSCSGLLSKMNNPFLSAASSPFQSIATNSGISANLPGSSTFSNSVSSFFEIGSIHKKSILREIKINSLYSPDKEILAFSAFSDISFLNNNISLKVSCGAGFFPYEEYSSSSWFMNSAFYHNGNHFCSFYQLSIKLPSVSTLFSTGIYETPFGSFSTLHRIDSQISSKHFVFQFSSLYNPNSNNLSIITSSDKTLEDCLQFNVGLQYKFVTGKNFPIHIKSGIMGYTSIKLSQEEHPVKISGGVQISSPFAAISLTGYMNATDNSSNVNSQGISFNDASIKLKNTFYLQNFIPSLSVSSSINPDKTYSTFSFTHKISTSLSHTSIPKISASGSYNISQQNEEIKAQKLSGTISSKFFWKNINLILKVSGNIEL